MFYITEKAHYRRCINPDPNPPRPNCDLLSMFERQKQQAAQRSETDANDDVMVVSSAS